jgi:hypothetical protein
LIAITTVREVTTDSNSGTDTVWQCSASLRVDSESEISQPDACSDDGNAIICNTSVVVGTLMAKRQ